MNCKIVENESRTETETEPTTRCGFEVTDEAKQQAGIRPSIKRVLPVPEQTLLMGSDAEGKQAPVLLYIVDAWPAESWTPPMATLSVQEANSPSDIMVEAYIRPLEGGSLPMFGEGYQIQADSSAAHIQTISAGCLFGCSEMGQHPDVPSEAKWRVEE